MQSAMDKKADCICPTACCGFLSSFIDPPIKKLHLVVRQITRGYQPLPLIQVSQFMYSTFKVLTKSLDCPFHGISRHRHTVTMLKIKPIFDVRLEI